MDLKRVIQEASKYTFRQKFHMLKYEKSLPCRLLEPTEFFFQKVICEDYFDNFHVSESCIVLDVKSV